MRQSERLRLACFLCIFVNDLPQKLQPQTEAAGEAFVDFHAVGFSNEVLIFREICFIFSGEFSKEIGFLFAGFFPKCTVLWIFGINVFSRGNVAVV